MRSTNPPVAARIDELEIKARVLNELRDQKAISRASIIANEFRVGKTGVRADMAILDGVFTGVEIKSRFDSLKRLPRQLPAYKDHFEHNILVVASRHLKAVKARADDSFSLWEIRENGNLIVDTPAQAGGSYNSPIWRDMLLQANLKRISDDIDHAELRTIFVEYFVRKYRAASLDFWKRVGRRRITGQDVMELSIYRDSRLLLRQWQSDRANKWSEWLEKSANLFGDNDSK